SGVRAHRSTARWERLPCAVPGPGQPAATGRRVPRRCHAVLTGVALPLGGRRRLGAVALVRVPGEVAVSEHWRSGRGCPHGRRRGGGRRSILWLPATQDGDAAQAGFWAPHPLPR